MTLTGRSDPSDSCLLVVDIQEKLLPKIINKSGLVKNVAFLLDVARELDVPLLATEQYPAGLGSTVTPLADMLPRCESKKAFSACGGTSVLAKITRKATKSVVVVGIETHVCIWHTVRDFLENDLRVVVPVDAVGARSALDHDVALRRMERDGAVLTTTEALAFEWMETAEHPKFKPISTLIQQRMKVKA